MTKKDFIHKKFPLICLVLSLALFVLSMTDFIGTGNLEKAVAKTEERVAERISTLNEIIDQTLATNPSTINGYESIDSDIVIYRYVNDSLVFWNNQFPILNDDISRKMVFHRLSPFDNRIESPLADVKEEFNFMSIGPKWYIIKYVDGIWNDRIIAGLEIKNTLEDESYSSSNGINPALDLSISYSIQPLSYNGGMAVSLDGVPQFKIVHEASRHLPILDNCVLRWIAILIFSLALILFLAGHRTFKVYFTVVTILCALTMTAYFWSGQLSDTHQIFSPRIFSDDTFPSLGALLLTNALIFIINICTFIIKDRIAEFINKDRKRAKLKASIYGAIILTSIIVLIAYIHITLKSFIIHSNVSLELYKASDNILYTVIVYLSYTLLFACIPFMLQELRPAELELTGKDHNLITRKSLIVFAFICAAYFTITTAILGFRKEEEKVEVWAASMTDDRSARLEATLNEIEEKIAEDQNISAAIIQDRGGMMILNRVREYYLNDYEDSYDMNVTIIQERDRMGQSLFNEIIHNGTSVTDGRKFMFLYDKQGHGKYAGVFLYFHKGTGVRRLILQIEPKTNKEGRGYHNILSHYKKSPGINIPNIYSYAKYKDGRLTTYNGTFPYPNVADIYQTKLTGGRTRITYRTDNHVHFIIRTGEDEVAVLSRPQRTGMLYFTSLSYLFLAMTLLSLLIPTRKKNMKTFRSNYFRTRISIIIFVSSFLLLSSLALASITFVYNRNEQNMFDMMKTRVNTIQGMFEARIRTTDSWESLTSTSFTSLLKEIGDNTKSDISLYTPEGKVFSSTSPEIFENRILGSRIKAEAFNNIQSRSMRFYIMEEETGEYKYWTIYAPLINDKGKIIAIMATPYTDMDYDFMKESFFHAAMIINVFILLLILSLVVTNRIINSMFSPLVEMGKKMSRGSVNDLEYIIYKREDEISSLVDAYNRMVKDLSDSTRQLAQAERDKAWSQMARQVAHEIKNPLTPIKLEIQRLIRMKQNNNPKWEEKFDQVTAVVLEHIQILSDTANEFSTFAKLYTEEPVLMDLDKIIKDQILIFDNKESIEISYIGLENAMVLAPKPQLIRVFVNLITNAIQAVEIQQKEAAENGETHPVGKVLICLRHGTKDGFYDITFEDNGPGVKGENLDKLFTPNFTTKSAGTGLGLAICRNIIEKCEGEIGYQKSFALGGACFVVSIPKTK